MEFYFKGLDKLIRVFDKAKVDLPEELNKAMIASVVEIKQEAQRLVPVFKNPLRDSISEMVDRNPLIGRVSVGQPYGKYVEFGTRPHRPPVSAIEDWATKHGINPWALVNSIAKKGTKKHPFMKPAFENNRAKVLKYFTEARNIIVKRLGL